jgi:DNA gyrase subunit A
MVALVDGVPRTLRLRELRRHYVGHQREVVMRRAKYELAASEARAHVLEGLLIALDNLDAVIELIRRSSDRDAAREELIDSSALRRSRPRRSSTCACSQLTALESDAIKQEHAERHGAIRELRELLATRRRSAR